jgi:8-oxo-dGTP pyrophosphatase MutT (NUDIX family)
MIDFEKSCGAVIYTELNGMRLYLIEQMQKGHCSICKGHLEKDESEHQTAAREILEETGLTVKFVEGFREIIEYSPYENCLKTVVFFLAYTDSMNVVSQEEEIKEIYWLSFDEAMTALTFDSDRATLQKAEQFLA